MRSRRLSRERCKNTPRKPGGSSVQASRKAEAGLPADGDLHRALKVATIARFDGSGGERVDLGQKPNQFPARQVIQAGSQGGVRGRGIAQSVGQGLHIEAASPDHDGNAPAGGQIGQNRDGQGDVASCIAQFSGGQNLIKMMGDGGAGRGSWGTPSARASRGKAGTRPR